MKKQICAVLLAAATAVTLAGCGDTTNKEAYLRYIKASDYVDLPDYSNIPVSVPAKHEVTDDEVESMVQYQLSGDASYQEVEGKTTVESGDTVNIDYVGKKDGKAFDGGTASDYNLTIGSNSFIDGFEDGLIGKKVGETVDLDLTFPTDYSNADLAGQDVVFTVTINKIVELVTPELTDDWVAKQNITGVSTVDEFRTYIRKQAEDYYQQNYDTSVEAEILNYLTENSTFKKDPPEAMVDRYYNNMVTYYSQQLYQQYGMDLDTYTSLMGLDDNSESASSADSAADTAIEEGAAEGVTEDASTEATSVVSEEVSSTAASDTADAAASSAVDTAASETAAVADSATADLASTGEESAAAASTGVKTYQWIRDDATSSAKRYIILQAIADEQDLNLKGRDLKSALSTEAAQQGYSSLDDYLKTEDSEEYREYLMSRAVIDYLKQHVTVTTLDTTTDSSSTGTSEDASTAASVDAADTASSAASTEDAAETADTAASDETADTAASDESGTGMGYGD